MITDLLETDGESFISPPLDHLLGYRNFSHGFLMAREKSDGVTPH